MLHKRRKAAQDIVTHLLAAEAAIDDAVNKTAALAACMPNARLDANLAAEIGHDALAGAMQSCQALVEARAQIVETHRRLAVASERIGVPARAFGPVPNKPPSGSAELHVVTATAA